MRTTTTPRLWRLRRPAVSPPWFKNPWIHPSSNQLLELRMQAEDDASTRKQYKAAIGTWEDEGGSLRTDVLRT